MDRQQESWPHPVARAAANARVGVALLTCLLMALAVGRADAAGILRDGVGGRAVGMAGADVAWAEGPLAAMAANPAALRLLNDRTLDLGVTGVLAEGNFKNRVDSDGSLESAGALPEFALGLPLGPVTLGFSMLPASMLDARWKYTDPPGVGGVSYGKRTHESQILVVRTAAGAAVSLGPMVSAGASLGLVYNQNSLRVPYIFQTEPHLMGLKTRLDLETSGFSWDWSAGLLIKPRDDLRFGIAYHSGSNVETTGRAIGKIGAQLAALGLPLHSEFRYDADVETSFPQSVSAGMSWNPLPRWRLALQFDWIDWSDAFDKLRVALSDGNNADVNAVIGSSSLKDTPPLRWRDQFVYRIGVEYAVLDNLLLRAGYAYSKSPVPNRTLTPLTATIWEHVVAAGAGYRWGSYQIDVGYQYDVPATRRVGTSDLLSGEYSGTRTEVEVHWLSITTSIRF